MRALYSITITEQESQVTFWLTNCTLFMEPPVNDLLYSNRRIWAHSYHPLEF